MRVSEWSKEASKVLYGILNPSAHADGTDSKQSRLVNRKSTLDKKIALFLARNVASCARCDRLRLAQNNPRVRFPS